MVYFVGVLYFLACLEFVLRVAYSDFRLRKIREEGAKGPLSLYRLGSMFSVMIWTIIFGRFCGWW